MQWPEQATNKKKAVAGVDMGGGIAEAHLLALYRGGSSGYVGVCAKTSSALPACASNRGKEPHCTAASVQQLDSGVVPGLAAAPHIRSRFCLLGRPPSRG